jgi:hypothetical protein
MKWNWGTKLLIAIILFMGFILTLVYLSTLYDISLVEKDYYPKGLKYQDRIDEITNAKPYLNEFAFSQNNEEVIVSLPEIDPDTGTIVFFRPSGTQMDRMYQLSPDSAFLMHFPLSAFTRGKYIAKIFWREADKGFYIEKTFYFN